MPGCELMTSDLAEVGIELICQQATPDLIAHSCKMTMN